MSLPRCPPQLCLLLAAILASIVIATCRPEPATAAASRALLAAANSTATANGNARASAAAAKVKSSPKPPAMPKRPLPRGTAALTATQIKQRIAQLNAQRPRARSAALGASYPCSIGDATCFCKYKGAIGFFADPAAGCTAYYWRAGCYAAGTGVYKFCSIPLLFDNASSVCNWPKSPAHPNGVDNSTCSSATIASLSPSPSPLGPNVVVTFTVDSNWTTGYQGTISIKNNNAYNILNWQLDFTFADTFAWGPDATITRTGNQVTLKPKDWNKAINAGATLALTFGSQQLTPYGFAFTQLLPLMNPDHDPSLLARGKFGSKIRALRLAHGDVVVSFGGANGQELAQAIGDVDTLTAAYQSVIDLYKLAWIDFDVEGAAVAERASVDRRNAALVRIRAANPGLVISYTLPVLPSGLTADGVGLLNSSRDHGFVPDVINLMTMDFGDSAAPSPDGKMGAYAIAAAQATRAQAVAAGLGASAIGLTPMIGVNDVSTEVFYAADAAQVAAFAATMPWVRWTAFWSVNRDNFDGSRTASPSSSGVPQQPYDFTRAFQLA
eukprot:scaffold6.g2551.t1